ncbi:MAG: hypothetical protein WBQ14_09370 [Gaiellaceae bacterium]
MLIRVPHETDEDGKPVVPLLAALRPVYEMGEAVKRGGYQRLFRLRSRARRLDWFVFLAPALSADGWTPWTDISFPGRRPAVRARHANPAQPQFGLAGDELRSRPQRKDSVEMVRAVATHLIEDSGWSDGVEAAVDDAMATLQTSTMAAVEQSGSGWLRRSRKAEES